MKIKNVIIGLLIIAFAVFGILEVTGVLPPVESVIGEISYFRFICALIILIGIVKTFCDGQIYFGVFLLSFMFMVLESNIAFMCGLENKDIINNWLLLLFTVIICIGLRFIIPKKKKGFHISRTSDGINITSDKERKEHSFSAANEYIDCSIFTERSFENNLGQTVIRFENVDEYIGEGRIYIENNLGNTVIYVPSDWRIVTEIENNLGSVKNSGNVNAHGPILHIIGENNLGAIEIVRV